MSVSNPGDLESGEGGVGFVSGYMRSTNHPGASFFHIIFKVWRTMPPLTNFLKRMAREARAGR